MKNEMLSKVAFGLSVVAVIIAIVDSTKTIGLWLSATSWLVIAGVLGIWAIYFSVCGCDCCQAKKE